MTIRIAFRWLQFDTLKCPMQGSYPESREYLLHSIHISQSTYPRICAANSLSLPSLSPYLSLSLPPSVMLNTAVHQPEHPTLEFVTNIRLTLAVIVRESIHFWVSYYPVWPYFTDIVHITLRPTDDTGVNRRLRKPTIV